MGFTTTDGSAKCVLRLYKAYRLCQCFKTVSAPWLAVCNSETQSEEIPLLVELEFKVNISKYHLV